MSIKGMIFDFDGTLVDTLHDLTGAVNAGLRAFDLAQVRAEQIREWIGDGLAVLCERAIGGAPGVPIEEMAGVVTRYYGVHRLDTTAVYPGVPELLDELTCRGIALAILSNKPHESTVAIAEALLARWPFVAIEGCVQEDRRKPDPRTAREIVTALGLAPAEVMLVGDSPSDIATALNAGLVPVGATWGYRSRQQLIDAGAALLIDRPAELLTAT